MNLHRREFLVGWMQWQVSALQTCSDRIRPSFGTTWLSKVSRCGPYWMRSPVRHRYREGPSLVHENLSPEDQKPDRRMWPSRSLSRNLSRKNVKRKKNIIVFGFHMFARLHTMSKCYWNFKIQSNPEFQSQLQVVVTQMSMGVISKKYDVLKVFRSINH